LEHAKRPFYRAAKAVFSKTGRVASEEVTPQLIKSKCLPVLLYGLEACPLPSQICSHSILSLTGSSWNSLQLKVLKL